MQIVCPHCSSENKIDFSENILCGECKKTFAGHLYKKFKKPFLSTTTALLVGAFGAYHLDNKFIEKERYPVGVEYELIHSCLANSGRLMDSNRMIAKTTRCVCALENTMSDFSYKEMKKSESEFITRFTANITSCR